jgi:hypothetical protein
MTNADAHLVLNTRVRSSRSTTSKNTNLNYESLLVRLPRISPGLLRDLLGMAHKFVSGKAKKRSKKLASPRTKS